MASLEGVKVGDVLLVRHYSDKPMLVARVTDHFCYTENGDAFAILTGRGRGGRYYAEREATNENA